MVTLCRIYQGQKDLHREFAPGEGLAVPASARAFVKNGLAEDLGPYPPNAVFRWVKLTPKGMALCASILGVNEDRERNNPRRPRCNAEHRESAYTQAFYAGVEAGKYPEELPPRYRPPAKPWPKSWPPELYGRPATEEERMGYRKGFEAGQAERAYRESAEYHIKGARGSEKRQDWELAVYHWQEALKAFQGPREEREKLEGFLALAEEMVKHEVYFGLEERDPWLERMHTRDNPGEDTAAGDSEKLKQMRSLGVVWRQGRLPRYPPSMADQDKKKADVLYDSMSEGFVDRMMARWNQEKRDPWQVRQNRRALPEEAQLEARAVREREGLVNYHACRQLEPGTYEVQGMLTLTSKSQGKPFQILREVPKKRGGQGRIISLRFPVEYWTADDAKDWCKAHGYKVGRFFPARTRENPRIPGGRDFDPRDFDPDALEEGALEELEHTDDMNVAREIAMAHLEEDPDYYRKLREAGL